MNEHNSTRTRLFRRSLLAIACSAAAAPAFSQTAAVAAPAASAASAPAASAPAAPEAAQQVVVSGSRIKHDTFSSAAPLQIIKSEDSALAGITTVAGILQSTAVTGGQLSFSVLAHSAGIYVLDGPGKIGADGAFLR